MTVDITPDNSGNTDEEEEDQIDSGGIIPEVPVGATHLTLFQAALAITFSATVLVI